jgi:hypothetical protein
MHTIDDSIPDLKIEHMQDGIGDGLILLEQDNCGNIDRVAIHPLHLRFMAEQMGLVESSAPQAQKTIATLKRRLLMLRDRIDHLTDWLLTKSDYKHADLSYEQTYATATSDIAGEFCTEIEELAPAAATRCSDTGITQAKGTTEPMDQLPMFNLNGAK